MSLQEGLARNSPERDGVKTVLEKNSLDRATGDLVAKL
jgi:hypothetical protein